MKGFILFAVIFTMIISGVEGLFAQKTAQQPATATVTYSIVDSLNATEGVTIVVPDALAKRLSNEASSNTAASQANATTANKPEGNAQRGNVKGGAFRVEFYSDNTKSAKTNATARRRMVQNRFPNYPTTLVFDSPFWRVKVGSFATRSDAEAAVAELKRAFPAYAHYIRVVRN